MVSSDMLKITATIWSWGKKMDKIVFHSKMSILKDLKDLFFVSVYSY